MRPGCIFVSHRSILIWLICCIIFFFFLFIAPCKYCRRVWGFLPSFVIFSECCILCLFVFQKVMYSMFLARHFSLWWVPDGLKVLLEGDVVSVGLRLRRAVSGPQYGEDGDTNSAVNRQARPLTPPPAQPCLLTIFFYRFLLTVILNSLNLPFSTCAIQRYFSTSLYSFWCTFFSDVCYISLMVNGYKSQICKNIWWFCTARLGRPMEHRAESVHRGTPLVQRGLGNSPPQEDVFTSRDETTKNKHSMICLKENY